MEEIRTRLIQLGLKGFNKGILDDEKLKHYCKTRDSFFHRIECILLSRNHLRRLMESIKKYLDANPNAIIPGKDSINLMNSIKLESSYFLENFIFHLISSLDHIKDIVSFFYVDINRAGSLRRTLYTQIKKAKHRFVNLKILDFVENPSFYWLITESGQQGFYQYRANIYHHLSGLCNIQLSYKYEESEGASTYAKVEVPSKLAEIRPDIDSSDIVFFVNKIIEDYTVYILALINAIDQDIDSVHP